MFVFTPAFYWFITTSPLWLIAIYFLLDRNKGRLTGRLKSAVVFLWTFAIIVVALTITAQLTSSLDLTYTPIIKLLWAAMFVSPMGDIFWLAVIISTVIGSSDSTSERGRYGHYWRIFTFVLPALIAGYYVLGILFAAGHIVTSFPPC